MKFFQFTFIALLMTFQSATAQWATSGANIYNTNTGFVGIGTTAIDRLFTVNSNGTGTSTAQARFSSFSSTQADASIILFSKGAGTNSSPLPVSSGDVLGIIQSQGWKTTSGFITGASITFNGVGAPGSRVPTDIIFNAPTNAADVQALAIKSGGYVGVGTTSPSQIFDVTGTSGVFTGTTRVNSSFLQDHTNYRGVSLGYDDSGQIGVIAGSGTSSNLAFWNNGSSGWFEAMRLTNAGCLGIGTIAPLSTLQVMGSVIASGTHSNLDPIGTLGSLPNNLVNTGQMLTGWNRHAGFGETDFIANQGPGSSGGFAFYNHDNSNNETMLMWVMGTGNVLIGKATQTNSSYKLDVAGNVRANQVVVNTTGADFAFEPAYHLFPLADLKKYIDQNHHLPEIASAKEMQTDGLNIGDNQIKLLQKIEELTLYMIEKDKQISAQQIEIAKQQKQISEQQDINQKQSIVNQSQQEQINLLKVKFEELTRTINKN